jgi:hypothetical protein
MTNQNKNKVGRPSKYGSIDLTLVEKLASYGLTEEEIADCVGICRASLDNYKNEHPEFLGTLKKGKDKFDAQVVKALHHRAIGYDHEEDVIMQYKGTVIVKPTTKHYPPDTAACIFWLKNRRKDEWRDKVDHEHSGKDGEPVKFVIENSNGNGKKG